MNSSSIGRARVTRENSELSSANVRISAQRAMGPRSRTSAATTTNSTLRSASSATSTRSESRWSTATTAAGPRAKTAISTMPTRRGRSRARCRRSEVGDRPDGEQQQQTAHRVEQAGRPGLVGGDGQQQGAEVREHQYHQRATAHEVVDLDLAALDEERQAAVEEPPLGRLDLGGRGLDGHVERMARAWSTSAAIWTSSASTPSKRACRAAARRTRRRRARRRARGRRGRARRPRPGARCRRRSGWCRWTRPPAAARRRHGVSQPA